jgi:hypothetical protein
MSTLNTKSKDKKKESSFLVKIKYSENNTIQGTVHWLEKKKIVSFRSMMELMMLLSESLSKEELRSWHKSSGTLKSLDKASSI